MGQEVKHHDQGTLSRRRVKHQRVCGMFASTSPPTTTNLGHILQNCYTHEMVLHTRLFVQAIPQTHP